MKELVLRGTKLKPRSFSKFTSSVSFVFRKLQTESTLVKFSVIPRQVKLAPGPRGPRTVNNGDSAAVPLLTTVIHLLSFVRVFSHPDPHEFIGLMIPKSFHLSFDV